MKKSRMVLYIHGFGSSGEGGKALLLREYFQKRGFDFFAPSLSYVPSLAIATLEQFLKLYPDACIIGSSLGGYYATYLAQKYASCVVLINPAVDSAKTLKEIEHKEGFALNHYDLSRFEWNEGHIAQLKILCVERVAKPLLLLLQKGDEVLDYTEALAKFPYATQIVEEGGSHRFDAIERHFERMEQFFTLA